jgi:hypothetical protein
LNFPGFHYSQSGKGAPNTLDKATDTLTATPHFPWFTSPLTMDSTTDEFGLDLTTFDIRDYAPEGDGNSLFDDQGQHRGDKARQQQQQRSHIQNSSQNLGPGYYGYPQTPDMNPGMGMSNNLPLGSMPNAPLSLEQLNMLLNMGLGQSNMGQDSHQPGGGSGSAHADQLKEQLAQQIKLQQLQQLQNHILQQQVIYSFLF